MAAGRIFFYLSDDEFVGAKIKDGAVADLASRIDEFATPPH